MAGTSDIGTFLQRCIPIDGHKVFEKGALICFTYFYIYLNRRSLKCQALWTPSRKTSIKQEKNLYISNDVDP